jgi:hypothetical protein
MDTDCGGPNKKRKETDCAVGKKMNGEGGGDSKYYNTRKNIQESRMCRSGVSSVFNFILKMSSNYNRKR